MIAGVKPRQHNLIAAGAARKYLDGAFHNDVCEIGGGALFQDDSPRFRRYKLGPGGERRTLDVRQITRDGAGRQYHVLVHGPVPNSARSSAAVDRLIPLKWLQPEKAGAFEAMRFQQESSGDKSDAAVLGLTHRAMLLAPASIVAAKSHYRQRVNMPKLDRV
jgi:hypothetical protein